MFYFISKPSWRIILLWSLIELKQANSVKTNNFEPNLFIIIINIIVTVWLVNLENMDLGLKMGEKLFVIAESFIIPSFL